jgi:hypothetical protein
LSIALVGNFLICWPSRTNSMRNSNYLFYSRAKFYAAEIVLALEELHKNKIIYREY